MRNRDDDDDDDGDTLSLQRPHPLSKRQRIDHVVPVKTVVEQQHRRRIGRDSQTVTMNSIA